MPYVYPQVQLSLENYPKFWAKSHFLGTLIPGGSGGPYASSESDISSFIYNSVGSKQLDMQENGKK